MNHRIIKYLNRISLITACLLLGGCKMVIMNPWGSIAADEKSLLITSTLLMLLVVIPVIVMTIVFAFRYRESNSNASYDPTWTHSNRIEAVCWAIPCVIIVILSVMTWTSTHKLDPYKPLVSTRKPLIVEAIALNWKWLFIYPQQHIATINYLELPVNQPIKFLITSDAPMNSFQIPQLAGQIYAMAGMQTRLNLIAGQTGRTSGLSTNFSGNGFAQMDFPVDIVSDTEFKNWFMKIQQGTNNLTIQEYNKLMLPTRINPVITFGKVTDNLYQMVLMKYMMPMNSKMKVNQNA